MNAWTSVLVAFMGQMSFLSPSLQYQSTEGIYFVIIALKPAILALQQWQRQSLCKRETFEA